MFYAVERYANGLQHQLQGIGIKIFARALKDEGGEVLSGYQILDIGGTGIIRTSMIRSYLSIS